MALAELSRYTVDPNAVIITRGVYETSLNSLALMFEKVRLISEMATPVSQYQKIAFEIIADCMQAEKHLGPEFRAKVLGVNVGRLM